VALIRLPGVQIGPGEPGSVLICSSSAHLDALTADMPISLQADTDFLADGQLISRSVDS
jgi:hypothetical protein